MAQQAPPRGNEHRRAAGPSSACSTRTAGAGRRSRRSFWFILLIFLLGYIPDRAYYFTVNKTIDLGHPRLEPGQLLPAGERDAAVPGAGRRGRAVGGRAAGDLAAGSRGPTAPSSSPARRCCTSAGQRRHEAGRHDVRRDDVRGRATSTSGRDGPEAARGPHRRRRRSFSGGKIYCVGGIGPDGKPTDDGRTSSTPGLETGALGEWQTAEEAKLDLDLPRAARRGGRSCRPPTGCSSSAGRDGTTPVDTVWKSTFDKSGKLRASGSPQPGTLYHAGHATRRAAVVGELPLGLRRDVGRRQADEDGPARRVRDRAPTPTQDRPRSGVARRRDRPARAADEPRRLRRERRALRGRRHRRHEAAERRCTGRSRRRRQHPRVEAPRRRATCRPAGWRGGAPVILGPDAIIVGGDDDRRGRSPASARANLAPQAPFFQLGLVGATVPALKIDGEIGQQLGYLNANTIGIVELRDLRCIIGWAFAHREQIKEWRERRRRERSSRARLSAASVGSAQRIALAGSRRRRGRTGSPRAPTRPIPPATFADVRPAALEQEHRRGRRAAAGWRRSSAAAGPSAAPRGGRRTPRSGRGRRLRPAPSRTRRARGRRRAAAAPRRPPELRGRRRTRRSSGCRRAGIVIAGSSSARGGSIARRSGRRPGGRAGRRSRR